MRLQWERILRKKNGEKIKWNRDEKKKNSKNLKFGSVINLYLQNKINSLKLSLNIGKKNQNMSGEY